MKRQWDNNDISLLRSLYCNGKIPIEEMVSILGRSVNAVHLKANRLGLTRSLKEVMESDSVRQKISSKARERTGPRNPFYGRKHKKESLERMKRELSLKMKGSNNPFYGKSHSPETRLKMSLAKRHMFDGERNPAWRGGYEPYYGPNWEEQRRSALERDGFKCVLCGKRREENGKDLDVHHIIPFRVFGRERYEEANDLSNLITLCMKCHRRMLRREYVRFPNSDITCIHNGMC